MAKYIGKYKGKVGTTHGDLYNGKIGYYNRVMKKYLLIGGYFDVVYPDGTTTSGVSMNGTMRLKEDDNSIDYSWGNTIPLRGLSPITNTWNGTTAGGPPYDGSINNIVVVIDNTDQPFSESDVIKINRLNSEISQADRIYTNTHIKNGERREFSFWYKGTYGTSIEVGNLASQNILLRYWDGSDWVGTTNSCTIPVTTNKWQQIRIRGTNTSGIDKQYINYITFHQNYMNTTIRNIDNWKITLLRDIDFTSYGIYDLTQDKTTKKIYAALLFSGIIFKLNPDGTKDETFDVGSGFNDRIRRIYFDDTNQKLYCGGYFKTFNGLTQNYLVRLNPDGTKDTSFDIGSGFNRYVYSLYFDDINQKIYVGGWFTSFNGSTQNYLVRLNYDGTKDETFNIGTGFGDITGFQLGIESLYYDKTNQKIYCGGDFTTFNGSTQNRLVRLNYDGSKDTTFNIGSGFGGVVSSLYYDKTNQKIYCGGYFTSFNGSTQNRLVRLNYDGSKDTTFNIGSGFNNIIRSLYFDDTNQKLYVGGDFTYFNGSSQNYLVRLNYDGSKDTIFIPQSNNSSIRTIIPVTQFKK